MNKSAVFLGGSPQSIAIKKRARADGNVAHLTEAEASLWELSRGIEVGLSGLASLAKDLEAMQVADKTRVDECRLKLRGICATLSLSAGLKSADIAAINTRYFETVRVQELQAVETDRCLGEYVRLHRELMHAEDTCDEERISALADEFYVARDKFHRQILSNA